MKKGYPCTALLWHAENYPEEHDLKWTKCSDRLPEHGLQVLVWDGTEYFVARLELREQGSSDIVRPRWDVNGDDWYVDVDVDWWTKLPEPPDDEKT